MTLERQPWPFPGDTALDRARRIAQSYRAELVAADPAAAGVLDARALAYGETWIVPQLATVDLDDLVTVDEAAELVGKTPAAIHKWITRDKRLEATTDASGRLRVRAGDLLDVHAEMRRKRAGRRRDA